jgi:glutaredoxin
MFTIYTKPECIYCQKAKDLFKYKGVTYKELVVEKDISSEEYRDIIPGFTTVPGIWYQGVFIGGYSELQSFLPN